MIFVCSVKSSRLENEQNYRRKLIRFEILLKNAIQAAKKKFATSLKRFQSGNFDVKDATRPDRPITGKVDEIVEKIEQNRHIISRDNDKRLNIDYKTVSNHLEKAGYKMKAREKNNFIENMKEKTCFTFALKHEITFD